MLNLNEYDPQTLARWWNTLNAWQWPEDMPGKPSNWESMGELFPRKEGKCRYITIINNMNDIQREIGVRECYRYYHMNICGWNEKEFENWYIKYGDDL